jgi:tetratricopeptide (TPR) repeat protein
VRVLALVLIAAAPAANATPAREVAAHTWMSVSTPHVEVLTDAGREVGERVAQQLEDLRTVLSLAAPALVVDVAPVQVILFRDATLAEAYAPLWHGQRDQVAGFFQTAPDRRRLLLQDDPTRLSSVAQHEYVHALLEASMPDVPLWLNEGLAEYFSTFSATADHAQAGGPIPEHIDWLAHHDLLSLSELFGMGTGSADYHEGDRRGTFYAESWLLTHMILSGADGDLERLERVLAATREGERFASAFEQAFGDEGALRSRLLAYFDRPRLALREWTLRSALSTREPAVRERVPSAEVLGSLGIALLARPTPQRAEATENLQVALGMDPRDPGACAGMGWLELQRGQRDEARDWFVRALERDPLSVPAVRLMATQLLLDASMRRSAAERESVAAFVRGAVERGRTVAPDDPELEGLLARSYVVSPGRDPAPGWPHIVRATEILPGRADLMLDRLALAALIGRDDEAWQLYDSHFRAAVRADLAHAARVALLSGAVREANGLLANGDIAGAERRLRAARDRLAEDADVVRDADQYLAQLRRERANERHTSTANAAAAEFDAGIRAANAQDFAGAAAAFRRAAATAEPGPLRERSLRMAVRMDLHVRGARAIALANAGDVVGARAIFESMDRASMTADDRRWLDANLEQLRGKPRR